MRAQSEEITTGIRSTQKDKYLTFSIGEEIYGVEIDSVREIIGIQTITEIPEVPGYIRGIINLRGQIIPVMDMRLRFRKPFLTYNNRTCIIVITLYDLSVGLIVDRVVEVITIPESEIVDPPHFQKEGNRYIKAIGKAGNDVKLLLDGERLLDDNEKEVLTEIQLEQ